MKNLLKKIYALVILKRVMRTLLECCYNFMYDCASYMKYSASVFQENDKIKLEGRICVLYHAIEKGMSLKNSQDGFGKEKIKKLIELCNKYKELGGEEELLVTCRNVLRGYCTHQEQYLDSSFLEELKSSVLYALESTVDSDGGVEAFTPNEFDFSKYKNFVLSRKSIRDFSKEDVAFEDLRDAIDVAKYTPSVCNRQPWMSYVYIKGSEIEQALSYQNGNRGFGEQVKGLILVTGEKKKFWHAIERNEVYVDGGMFSMSIVYALHAKNLSSCCLNLNMTARKEAELKKSLNIPASEALIMMIAVGKAESNANTAVSSRFSTEKFIGNL